MLEHISHTVVHRVLSDWRRTLRFNGVLLLSVPDLDMLARMLLDKEAFTMMEMRTITLMIYGGQVANYNNIRQ